MVRGLEVSGLLTRLRLWRSGSSATALGLFQRFEYADVGAFTLGGQGFDAGLVHRAHAGAGELLLAGRVTGLLLAGTSAEVLNRRADYGPAAGASAAATIRQAGDELLHLELGALWLRGITPNSLTHMTRRALARLTVPLRGGIGIRLTLSWADRRSQGKSVAEVERRQLDSQIALLCRL